MKGKKQVSITAVRIAGAELGDTVAVIGMGPVGNLAAQLFTMAGCDVIAIDKKDCAAAYLGLRDKKDEYLGVVFDWTRV